MALTLHSSVVMAFAPAVNCVFGFVVRRAGLRPFRVYFYPVFTMVPLDGATVRFEFALVLSGVASVGPGAGFGRRVYPKSVEC